MRDRCNVGPLMRRFTPRNQDGEPLLKAGGNELTFHAKGADGLSTRAMVTTVALGEPKEQLHEIDHATTSGGVGHLAGVDRPEFLRSAIGLAQCP